MCGWCAFDAQGPLPLDEHLFQIPAATCTGKWAGAASGKNNHPLILSHSILLRSLSFPKISPSPDTPEHDSQRHHPQLLEECCMTPMFISLIGMKKKIHHVSRLYITVIKIPVKDNLEKKMYICAHLFRRFSHSLLAPCCGSKVKQTIIARGWGRANLLNWQQSGSRERKKGAREKT